MISKETLSLDTIDAKQFEMAVQCLANSLNVGMDDSTFLGSGMEYLQSRPYEAGDAVKLIDWRITARTGKAYIKQYQAPKQIPTYILIDTSASMCVSSLKMSKYAWAVQIATGFALAAQARLSPVGLMGCGGRDLHITPTLSKNSIMAAGHGLRHYDFTEKTTLSSKIKQLGQIMDCRSSIIVVSDLHDPEAAHQLKTVAQEHETVVVHLQDPAEVGKLGGGFYRGAEAETGYGFVAHGGTSFSRRDTVEKDFSRAGVFYLKLQTDQPILKKIQDFLRFKTLIFAR